MAGNYRGPKSPVTVLAPAAVVAGQGVLVGTTFGVCGAAAASGEPVAFHTEGQYVLPKLSTDVVAQGATLYWDNASTPKQLTLVSTSNTKAGFAVEAAGNGVTSVLACLTGQV